MSARVLYYVADPMCSWCWGFHGELVQVLDELPANVAVEYVMGGLAVDSEEPMPDEIRAYVQDSWRQVTAHTGATFNWDFWTKCEPRRSTYPACRAVIAAKRLDPDLERPMFEAVQRAYYQEARNPSLTETLIEIASEIGLDATEFEVALHSEETEAVFKKHRALRRELGADGFPSLVLREDDGRIRLLMRGSGQAREILSQL